MNSFLCILETRTAGNQFQPQISERFGCQIEFSLNRIDSKNVIELKHMGLNENAWHRQGL